MQEKNNEVILKSYDPKKHIRLKISIKEAQPHPFDGAEQRHPDKLPQTRSGNNGEISTAVCYCKLEDELDCLCSYSAGTERRWIFI